MLCCSFSQTSWCKKQAAGYLHTCMTPDKHPSHLGFSSTFGYERVTTLGRWRATHPAYHPYYHLLAPARTGWEGFDVFWLHWRHWAPNLCWHSLRSFFAYWILSALAVLLWRWLCVHWHQRPQFDADTRPWSQLYNMIWVPVLGKRVVKEL